MCSPGPAVRGCPAFGGPTPLTHPTDKHKRARARAAASPAAAAFGGRGSGGDRSGWRSGAAPRRVLEAGAQRSRGRGGTPPPIELILSNNGGACARAREPPAVTNTDGTPLSADESPTVVSVHSGNSGKERRVDVAEGRCTCPDHQHREVECAHIRRARYAVGRVPVATETLAACDVHERFAEHAPGPVVATSDGGHVDGDTDDDSTDSTDSGLGPRS